MTVTVAIGLGSNLGDRAAHLAAAAAAVAEAVGPVSAVSSVYETAPVGGPDQGDYLNAVVVAETDLPPADVLERLLDIERGMGRERRERWGPRTIDLDILVYGEPVGRGTRAHRSPSPDGGAPVRARATGRGLARPRTCRVSAR